MRRYCCPRTYFYPRPPRGGRLGGFDLIAPRKNFYPRPPRGGRHDSFTPELVYETISIHALREEGDESWSAASEAIFKFLSTPSARRATGFVFFHGAAPFNFYPRPPRGGRRCRCALVVVGELISIHALREEGDDNGFADTLLTDISIHALREEGDSPAPGTSCTQRNFYPRPPRGGRHEARQIGVASYLFLSTPSARRATLPVGALSRAHSQFLSTPSARRATGRLQHPARPTVDFYPRPPRGGRR